MKIDTKDFSERTAEDYKRQTQAHWGDDPCGSNTSDNEYLSREYFEDIEAYRYGTHPWILESIRGFGLEGKDVLEIGFGMGTDHLSLARQGANLHGIDLTPRNREVVERRFELYGESTTAITGDAENLPYPDNSFDFVYSFGVIHHSPDTERIISEIHRVLRPGGRCWITVYNRNSAFFWWSVFAWDWIICRGFRRETLQQRLSRIEYPNDNPDLVIRLYGKREFGRMFGQFSRVETSVDQLLSEDVAGLGGRIPDHRLRRLGRHIGWYVIADATK
jgi:ubiquinone/menaquinone biosynthesis C-methylase UbiE